MAKNFTQLALPLMLASCLVNAAEQQVVSYSLFGGLTNGGDYFATDVVDTYTNAKIEYHNAQNPDNQLPLQVTPVSAESNYPDLRAGGFAVVGAGVNFKLNSKVDLQLNAGYHWDRKEDPALKMSRFELELIPYYQVNDNIRVGFGITHHFNNQFDSSAVFSEHSQKQLEQGLYLGGADGAEPQNNYDVISAALFTQFNNYHQLLNPDQAAYDAADFAMIVNQELSNGTGWVGSVTYDWPAYKSRLELRVVTMSYNLDTAMTLVNRQDPSRAGVISSNKRQTVDGDHVGLYYHWLF